MMLGFLIIVILGMINIASASPIKLSSPIAFSIPAEVHLKNYTPEFLQELHASDKFQERGNLKVFHSKRGDYVALDVVEEGFRGCLEETLSFYTNGEVNVTMFERKYKNLEKKALSILSTFFINRYPESPKKECVLGLGRKLSDEFEKLIKVYENASGVDYRLWYP